MKYAWIVIIALLTLLLGCAVTPEAQHARDQREYEVIELHRALLQQCRAAHGSLVVEGGWSRVGNVHYTLEELRGAKCATRGRF